MKRVMSDTTTHTLIKAKEVLQILPWVSRHGLYRGSAGTGVLTKFPAGGMTLYSKEECEALRDSIIEQGMRRSAKAAAVREFPGELV